MASERPPVDWRTRQKTLDALTRQVARLSRPDAEWGVGAPARSSPRARAAAPQQDRASVEEALRLLGESQRKIKAIKHHAYEPKTLRLREAAADAPSSPARPLSPVVRQPEWETGTVQPSFLSVKEARTASPRASLGGDVLRAGDWEQVKASHRQRKKAAELAFASSPSSPSPLLHDSEHSPRMLRAISPVSQYDASYATSPRRAAQLQERRRVQQASATRGGTLGGLSPTSYTPGHQFGVIESRTPTRKSPVPEGVSPMSTRQRAVPAPQPEPEPEPEPRTLPQPQPEPEPQPSTSLTSSGSGYEPKFRSLGASRFGNSLATGLSHDSAWPATPTRWTSSRSGGLSGLDSLRSPSSERFAEVDKLLLGH